LGITRPGLGALFQNLAFLVNIERWNAILTVPTAANIQKNSIIEYDELNMDIN